MAKVVNLNQHRKRKGRAEKDSHAAENRVKFGRTGTQKKNDTDNRDRESANLSGKELTGDAVGKTPDEHTAGDGERNGNGGTPGED